MGSLHSVFWDFTAGQIPQILSTILSLLSAVLLKLIHPPRTHSPIHSLEPLLKHNIHTHVHSLTCTCTLVAKSFTNMWLRWEENYFDFYLPFFFSPQSGSVDEENENFWLLWQQMTVWKGWWIFLKESPPSFPIPEH